MADSRLTPERIADMRDEAAQLRYDEIVEEPLGNVKRVWDCPRMDKEDLRTLLDAYAERDTLAKKLESWLHGTVIVCASCQSERISNADFEDIEMVICEDCGTIQHANKPVTWHEWGQKFRKALGCEPGEMPEDVATRLRAERDEWVDLVGEMVEAYGPPPKRTGNLGTDLSMVLTALDAERDTLAARVEALSAALTEMRIHAYELIEDRKTLLVGESLDITPESIIDCVTAALSHGAGKVE